MRRVSVGAAAIVALLALGGYLRAVKADYPACGYVSNVSCPGCTSHDPTSGCLCGKNGEQCDCIKNGGGLQTELKVQCLTGAFDVVADENGYQISPGPLALCSHIYKCMKPGGLQTECGTYNPDKKKCTSPQGICDWRLFNDTWAGTYVQGELCNP